MKKFWDGAKDALLNAVYGTGFIFTEKSYLRPLEIASDAVGQQFERAVEWVDKNPRFSPQLKREFREAGYSIADGLNREEIGFTRNDILSFLQPEDRETFLNPCAVATTIFTQLNDYLRVAYYIPEKNMDTAQHFREPFTYFIAHISQAAQNKMDKDVITSIPASIVEKMVRNIDFLCDATMNLKENMMSLEDARMIDRLTYLHAGLTEIARSREIGLYAEEKYQDKLENYMDQELREDAALNQVRKHLALKGVDLHGR